MKTVILTATYLAFISIANAKIQKETETLVYTSETHIRKDGSATEKFEIVGKVLTEAGRTKLSISKVNFFKSQETFLLVEAYTLTEGKKSLISPHSVRITSSDRAEHGLSDAMEVAIPFDNISVGSEVHLRYDLIKKPIIGNIFAAVVGLSNQELGKIEYYKFISEVPLLTAEKDFGRFFKITKINTDGKYTITIEPTQMAYAIEGARIEEADLSVTTATSWKQVRELEAPLMSKL